MNNDKIHVENAISFIQQARQENLTAMHAIARNLTPGCSEAHRACANAAAMWEAAMRELHTYLGGWQAVPRAVPQRERERA